MNKDEVKMDFDSIAERTIELFRFLQERFCLEDNLNGDVFAVLGRAAVAMMLLVDAEEGEKILKLFIEALMADFYRQQEKLLGNESVLDLLNRKRKELDQ